MSNGIPVPADEPQEPPYHYTFFNARWLPIVVGSLVDLFYKGGWNAPPADIIPQVNTLIAMIEDELVIIPQIFPESALRFYQYNTIVAGTGLVYVELALMPYGGNWRHSTSSAVNESSFKVFLRKGTYKLIVTGHSLTTSPKLDIIINHLTTVQQDWYSAANTIKSITTTGIVFANDGQQEVNLAQPTKNAASAGFDLRLVTFYFERTGA